MSTRSDDRGCPVAHDNPEAPLEYGIWLCCCHECAVALHAHALARPGTPIVLKSGMDRKVVPAVVAALARVTGRFESLLDRPGDYLREVFVGSGPDFDLEPVGLPDPSDWAPCEECAHDEEP